MDYEEINDLNDFGNDFIKHRYGKRERYQALELKEAMINHLTIKFYDLLEKNFEKNGKIEL
jgi:hypothetical protein